MCIRRPPDAQVIEIVDPEPQEVYEDCDDSDDGNYGEGDELEDVDPRNCSNDHNYYFLGLSCMYNNYYSDQILRSPKGKRRLRVTLPPVELPRGRTPERSSRRLRGEPPLDSVERVEPEIEASAPDDQTPDSMTRDQFREMLASKAEKQTSRCSSTCGRGQSLRM